MSESRLRHAAGNFIQMLQSLTRLDVPAYAGNASFFIILATVPTLMLLLNILSYTNLGTVTLIEVMEDILPNALAPTVIGVLQRMFQSSSTTLVSITALASLWASSRGVYSILVGLNRVYGVREDRSPLYTRIISVIYTFLLLVVIVLTLVIYVFRNTLMGWLDTIGLPGVYYIACLIEEYFPLLTLLQTLVFTMMFMFMPNRKNRFISSLPGAIVAALGWHLYSYGFSIYVANFSKFSAVYGSLTTLVIAMIWLYVCIAIIFYGGALNKYLSDIGYQIRLKRRQRREANEARKLLEERQSKDEK